MPKLQILSTMNLDQAMAEVRRYLEAKNGAGSNPAPWASQNTMVSAPSRSSQFPMQAANLTRLSEIAAQLGEVEPHSEFGAAGVYLKRALRKVIGWYSRPAQQFDRATLEALHQVRQDMLTLQQQIAALRQEMANSIPVATQLAQPVGESVPAQDSSSEQAEVLRLMVELFKNLIAVQGLRETLQRENPELVQRVDTLLDRIEGESQELKAALLKRLAAD
ncbi:MAG: hypothetical protein ABSD98_02085 [Candidatus Korobacteraceae bacterium]|jgi:hypothetical protein